MSSYGMGPRLILNRRQQMGAPRVDYSAFASLTKPPVEPNPTDWVGMQPRSAEEAASGLGLPLQAQQQLETRITQILDNRDPLTLRRDLMESVRNYDPGLRKVVFQRVVDLWRSRRREERYEVNRPGIIQKSNNTGLYLADRQGLELVWMTTDEEPMGGKIEDTPPGWGLHFDLRKALTHKYKKRIPKPGGGYRYIYEESEKRPETSGPITEEELKHVKSIGTLPIDEHRALAALIRADGLVAHDDSPFVQSKHKTGSTLISGPNVVQNYHPKAAFRELYKKGLVSAMKLPGGVALLHPTRLGKQTNMHQPDLNQRLWGHRKYKGWIDPEHRPEMQVQKSVAMPWDLWKAGSHKYIKRVPTGKPKPKYRYYYKLPSRKGVAESEHLKEGAKFRAQHKDKVGHFEVVARHDKKGVVSVRHDESGEVIHVRHKDLANMVTSHYRRTTQESKAKAEGKPAPEKLPRVTMQDLQRGEWDTIVGMGSPEDLEAQAAAAGPGHEFAIIRQPAGHVLVTRKAQPPAGAVKRIDGEPTQLKFRGKSGKGIDTVKGRFVVVEAADLVASHRPSTAPTFDHHPQYPEGVQERRYHAVSAEADKVRRIASELDPVILVNTNPDGVNGTPIVTPDNVVLGGNGRTMAMQLAYQEYPEQAAKLKEHLIANAVKYGANAAQVRSMKQPVLVRQMKVDAKDTDKMRLWGRRMNEALTQGLDPRSEEVAVSHFVTDDLCQTLVDAIEPDETLGEFLYSSRAEDFVKSLQVAGIIDEFNKSQFLERDKDGNVLNRLNEDGRRRVERVMAARLIPDADILEKMNPSLREALALSTPSIIVAEKHGWDLKDSLRTAVQADLFIRRQYAHKPSAAALQEFLGQPELNMERLGVDLNKKIHDDEQAKMLLHVIRGKIGVKKTPRDFRGFALRAIQDYQDNAFSRGETGVTGGLFGGGSEMTPAEALDIEFGISPGRSKEKKQREAAARAEEKARKQAEKERKEAEGSTQEMFAASLRGTWPSLLKAAGPNALMNRAVVHAQLLVDAAVHRSTTAKGKVQVDQARIVQQVMGDVRRAALGDPELARGSREVTDEVVRGLVKTLSEMRTPAPLKKSEHWTDGDLPAILPPACENLYITR